MYDEHIDRAAIADATERHRAVMLRLDAARANLERAAAEADAADTAHFESLVAGNDSATTAARLRTADDAAKLAERMVAAAAEAVRRSEPVLRSEIAAAHIPARDAAEADLLAAAIEIDDLRNQVRDALARYRSAAIALNQFSNVGCHSAAVNANAPHADGAIAWAALPDDRNAAAFVRPRLVSNVAQGVAQ